ncbi:transcriptional regulator GutM [Butyricicoccus sp.]|uniref:transcriptional regulator GutM n=1 Tax=Butyricicoccus sp. TaxID=2049021 RepID=UPI0037352494
MLKLGLIVVAAFVLQAALSMLQMRHFSKEFVKLRRQGRVACGRKAGGFHAGAIVMFLIDSEGRIQAGRKLEGVTCLARVRPLDGLEGRYIGSLTEEDGPKGHRNLRKAIADAALTYNKYVAGEEIEQPPTPFQKVGISARNLVRRKSTAK